MTESEVAFPSAADARLAGRVVGLRTFPVKSLDGEQLTDVQVLASGVQHDRAWAVVDAEGRVVTGKRAPALKQLQATVAQAPAEGPALVLPGGDHRPVRGASADLALSRVVGEPVRLVSAEGADIGFNEVAAVHLVSRQGVAAAAEAEAAAAGTACDIEDPRANVVVDLAGGEDLETSWVGRQVGLGEVVLRVSKKPKHCLGVYAEVVRPGRVAVGDEVRLL